MNRLPQEFEERYGVAKGMLLPVTVSPRQLEMLRTAEEESNKGWNVMLLVFAGAKILAHAEGDSQTALRLPEFRVSTELLDLEDFETNLKAQVLSDYGLEIDLSRYLMLAHCAFMGNAPIEGDESDTSSRTLHVFTARALNSDDLLSSEEISSVARLVKPAALADALQKEWADARSQLNTGGTTANMRDEYDSSWAFVRARLAALAFHSLFNWDLPDV